VSELLERMAKLTDKQRALLTLKAQRAGLQTEGIPRRPRGSGPPPLSFAQARLWFLDQYAPGNPVYNVPYSMRLRGRLDVGALARALSELVRRHEVLRTTFDAVGGEAGDAEEEPTQVVSPPKALSLGPVDLSVLPPDEREERLAGLLTEEAQRPFDLRRGPLFRTGLLRLSPEDHVLLLTMHHIVSDGWSGRPSPLPELPIQYGDFAAWQREWLSGKVLEEQLSYWKEKLQGLAVLELPTDRPRPAVQTFKGTDLARVMPSALAEELKALSRREGVTLFMTVLAAYKALLHRYTGQEDIVVGSAIAGRNRSEIEPLIGFFINMLVLRSDFGGDPTFRDLLRQVRETTLGAYAHQDLPFEKLVGVLRPERDPSRTPLFQVVLTLQNAPAAPPRLPGLKVDFPPYELEVSRFDLSLNVGETAEGLVAAAEYSTDLFDESTMERFLAHYQRLLESVCADPGQRLSQLTLLTGPEHRRMVVDWNATAQPYPCRTIPGLFREQAARTPQLEAARFEGKSLTYEELDRRSDRLARHLRRLGLGPETLVGLCVERGLEQVVGMLGILKAGGAYLPLDPTYPRQRLEFMLTDAKAPLVLTQERLLESLPESDARVVCLDRDWEDIAAEGEAGPGPGSGPDRKILPGNIVYCIYTSGSTGVPKGVLIEHRAVANFINSVREIFEIGPGERVLQFASICFDVSVFETFSALLTGATLILARQETLLSPLELTELMQSEAVTVTDLPPAMMALLDSSGLESERIVFVGGEAFPAELVNAWNLPGRRFYNGYGPTECTVTMTLKLCEGHCEGSPPIGVPMPNHECYVLDRHLNPVPAGVSGELYISGAGLARGYHARPELTAERFVPDPFSGREGSRLYRTGDLVKYLPNGDIDFLGRVDDQVKIRGFRIELGEIETALTAHAAVRQAVVLAREDEDGQRHLVAYLVVEPGEEAPGVGALRAHLGERLPGYMIPAAFVVLDEFPMTGSGKVDRRALPVPDIERPDLEEDFVAPRTEVERALAEQVFGRVLGVERVGVNDNFFELGGNSLQATQLVSRIRSTFNVGIPLRVLFESPTVAGLARAVERARGGSPDEGPAISAAAGGRVPAPLVSLQTSGSLPPLFCVHPVGGTVFGYTGLARALGPDRPVYGLQAPGLEVGESPLTTVDGLAAHYVTALTGFRSGGPYLLAGWSMGGIVAFEMARRLQARGREAILVALLDVTAPGIDAPTPDDAELAAMFIRDMAGLLGKGVPPLDVGRFRGPDADRQTARVLETCRRAGLLPADVDRDELGRRLAVFKANVRAMWAYRPRSYAGCITLLRAEVSPDTRQGWAKWSAGVDAHTVPGDHYSMLQPPNLERLARVLRRCLPQAGQSR